MKIVMEKQVLSIEQMLKLKELGVDTSNASMQWVQVDGVYRLRVCGITYLDAIDTFTLQDILNILPKKIDIYRNDSYYYFDLLWNGMFDRWSARYEYYDSIDGRVSFPDESPLIACFDALVWCAENGYLKGGKQ